MAKVKCNLDMEVLYYSPNILAINIFFPEIPKNYLNVKNLLEKHQFSVA